ncbi:hypothetical protein HMPREF0281_01111 [Corynebacterium ammoniagenes DSM 20306]|uniref:Uncharacterized protein n=1 Tax=Corynebacterium ammoniagenes DSM 20306 TaxID=649754 RepID=A0ABN0AFV2_CORAM|nr:hypothetical protein HMPREF0281_01111 [Corynebacterium ammoniagenes DSM 20306]
MRGKFSLDDIPPGLIWGCQKGIAITDHDRLDKLQVHPLLRTESGHFRVRLFRASNEIFNDDTPRGVQGRLLVRHTKALCIEIGNGQK